MDQDKANKVLTLISTQPLTVRAIAAQTGLSLDDVKKRLHILVDSGVADIVSPAEFESMPRYRAKAN